MGKEEKQGRSNVIAVQRATELIEHKEIDVVLLRVQNYVNRQKISSLYPGCCMNQEAEWFKFENVLNPILINYFGNHSLNSC